MTINLEIGDMVEVIKKTPDIYNNDNGLGIYIIIKKQNSLYLGENLFHDNDRRKNWIFPQQEGTHWVKLS